MKNEKRMLPEVRRRRGVNEMEVDFAEGVRRCAAINRAANRDGRRSFMKD